MQTNGHTSIMEVIFEYQVHMLVQAPTNDTLIWVKNEILVEIPRSNTFLLTCLKYFFTWNTLYLNLFYFQEELTKHQSELLNTENHFLNHQVELWNSKMDQPLNSHHLNWLNYYKNNQTSFTRD